MIVPRKPKLANVSRRQFLKLMGATVGSAAVMNTMTAWGLMSTEAQTDVPDLGGGGDGTSVVVLGSGPGGCAAAYELMQAGYEVTILEAQEHIGGHVKTIRGGVKVAEYGNEEQVCDWEDGVWFDAGPSRVPFYHTAYFHYSKLFEIPQVEYNIIDHNAWMYAEGIEGQLNEVPLRVGSVQADMAGYTSELLAKAINQETLDQPITGDDREMLLSYLTNWGMIDRESFDYVSSDRHGYDPEPGVAEPGAIAAAYPFEDLLPYAQSILSMQSGYLSSVPTYDWQSTLLRPANGMEQLFKQGFQQQFGDRIKLNAPVQEIHQTDDGVTIVYSDPNTGDSAKLQADYCVCNLPLSVLIKLPADFDNDFTAAIRGVPYQMALRQGLAFNRRFWEEDDNIYGGQSFFNVPEVGIIHYPDSDYLTDKGALLGMYNFGRVAGEVSNLSNEERTEIALHYGSKIHPTYRDDFHSAISVAWHLMPYEMGAWPSYTATSRERYYPRLLEPDGRVYLVGEHLSYVNGWMEGAFQAAWYQVENLHKRVMQG